MVSRWTLFRRVKELGLETITGFSNISDERFQRITWSCSGKIISYGLYETVWFKCSIGAGSKSSCKSGSKKFSIKMGSMDKKAEVFCFGS